MDKSEDQKKSFCARCFLPVNGEEKIEIEGHFFHKLCSICCICRNVPSCLKMFNGHIFCNECFKAYVLNKCRSGGVPIYSNCWPQGAKSQSQSEPKENETLGETTESKRTICARCLLSVDECEKVTVCNQKFHNQCAKCCLCNTVPTTNLKIYYGQVFCEHCFYSHVLSRSRDNPAEFFKGCFEQWQNNMQFAQSMKGFMAGNSSNNCAPFIFVAPDNQSPSCKCGSGHSEWFSNNEPKKSVTPVVSIEESLGTWDLTFENRTEVSDILEIDELKNEENYNVIEKIEKLTKYLNGRDNERENDKNWKILHYDHSIDSDGDLFSWVDLQNSKKVNNLECPKCLWQCGSIYVNNEYLQRHNIKN